MNQQTKATRVAQLLIISIFSSRISVSSQHLIMWLYDEYKGKLRTSLISQCLVDFLDERRNLAASYFYTKRKEVHRPGLIRCQNLPVIISSSWLPKCLHYYLFFFYLVYVLLRIHGTVVFGLISIQVTAMPQLVPMALLKSLQERPELAIQKKDAYVKKDEESFAVQRTLKRAIASGVEQLHSALRLNAPLAKPQ